MEFIVKAFLSLKELFYQVLASPFNTVLATACIFLFSIMFFFLIYWFLYNFHQVNLVRYKGHNIIGAAVPLPAFELSDSLRKRLEVQAKNDLRIRDYAGEISIIAWQSFSQDNSLERQFPQEGGKWKDFNDFNVLGLTPRQMVEETFKKYGLLKYKVTFYRDNSFDSIFPIKVMQEYFQVQSVVDLQNRMNMGNLSVEENSLFQKLQTVAPQIRTGFLESKGQNQLGRLSELLSQFVSVVEDSRSDKERLRNIFYGEILSTIASGTIEFEFDSLPLKPELLDFFFMSTNLSMSNMPSEIIPITNDVRLVIWVQLAISYFILGLNIAALVKWLKLS